MTKPVNLFLLSRIKNTQAFGLVEKHASGRADVKRIHSHEIDSLRILVDYLIDNGISVDVLDGFFFGYQIPQIGKEFDLLKITDKNCLNIELKSQAVSEDEILDQLLKDRHYLSHLGKFMSFYTVVTDQMRVYHLTDDEQLQMASIQDLVNSIYAIGSTYLSDIDDMFRASNYLVSPLNNPERFINNEYFLTQSQEQIKKAILKDIFALGRTGFYSITGKPGTGKTLLIYDIAKTLAQSKKTMVIHCGKLSAGQDMLNQSIENFCVISAGFLKYHPNATDACQYILVDETHRIKLGQFEMLIDSIQKKSQVCVFSSDPEQTLSYSENYNAIASKIAQLPLLGQYALSEKIRTNKELASFIKSVIDLNNKPKIPMHYDNVMLLYADTPNEAKQIIIYLKNRNYTFINYSKSNYNFSPYFEYEAEEDFDTHHVIGQEFDNVLMLLDQSFYYDESGLLQGYTHPTPNYLYSKLFYQGITRVREKLALVIVGAPELFHKMSSVFEYNY